MYLSWNIIEMESGAASTPEETLSQNNVSSVVVATYGIPRRYLARVDGSVEGLDLSFWNTLSHSADEARQLLLDNFIQHYDLGRDKSESLAALGFLSSEDIERLID